MHDRMTTNDRYAKAVESARLTEHPIRLTDLDVLAAAGWAAKGDKARSLALQFLRLQHSRHREGLTALLDQADAMLTSRVIKLGQKRTNAIARRQIVADTVAHMLDPACRYCNGLGHHTVPGTTTLETGRCDACYGCGITPLARLVPKVHLAHAQWLQGLIERGRAAVLQEMRRMLQ